MTIINLLSIVQRLQGHWVAAAPGVLKYCDITGDETPLTSSPVVTELQTLIQEQGRPVNKQL